MNNGPGGLRPYRRRLAAGVAVLLAIGLAVGLTACGDDDEEGSGTASTAEAGLPGEGKTIGISLIGTNQYTQCMATGAIKNLTEAGYEVVGVDSKFDPQQEVANFNDLIGRDVDGILVLPVTPDSAARGAIAAEEAGIPTVSLAWAKPTAADDTYVGRVNLDNVQGAGLIVDWIEENTEPGEIVVVSGVAGNEFSDDFDAGLKKGIEELGGGWEIVGIEPGNYVRDDAITAAQNLFAAHPDASIIITAVAEEGVGVASWLQREGKDDIVHITSDGNLEMAGWMEDGFITADRYFSSAESGILGADLMRTYLEDGEATPEPVKLESRMVTADTLAQAEADEPLCYEEFLPQVEAFS